MIRALSILAALLVVADGVTTYRALKSGTKEANPVRAWLIQSLGLQGGTVGLSLVGAAGLVLAAEPMERNYGMPTAVALLLIVSVVCGLAVWKKG